MTIVKIKRNIANKNRNIDDDLDGDGLANSGCELVVVGDQTCNVPYDLYDLSDLKEVLSLNTWNCCLTEEERFSLSMYIPDIDHETFLCTLQALLNGKDLFFGSPLETFFRRMKSGFYSPQVVPVREGLRFLEKRKHYHSLVLYHDNMNRKFFDMKKAWSNCEATATVEERIRILNKKPLLLLDLNAIPQDGDCLDSPCYKKIKHSKKSKGKGLVKARPVEMNLLSSFEPRSEALEMRKRMPRGVLRIKPRGEFSQVERPVTVPFKQLLHHMEDVNNDRGQKTVNFPAMYKQKNIARAKIGPAVNNMDLVLPKGSEFEIKI